MSDTSGPAGVTHPSSGWRVAAASLVAVLLAASWMLISLAAGRAGLSQALTGQSLGQASLSQALTRTGLTNAGSKVQILLATPEYFERAGQAADEADPSKYLVFIVTEENHNALKPAPLPALSAGGQRVAAPAKERPLSSSDHHRTRMIRFLRADPSGASYLPPGTNRLELVWPDLKMAHRPDHTLVNPLSWEWPPPLPPETAAAKNLSLGTFLVLIAGLFAALSPCLIQLTLYYLSALAGTTASQGPGRRKIFLTALVFVAGVSVAYTTGGLLAGYAGRAVQVSGVLGEYGRWIAVGAGTVIVLMGLRSVIQSEAPLVCDLRLPGVSRLAKWKTGYAASFLMGFLMSLGCLQCFGGALFASLLVYVGSLGSPGLGALMLFVFSLGLAVPFLAAALAWERVSARIAGLTRVVQNVSLVSGVVMMAFGILMIVDKFHWVSGWLLRWMPFLQA